MVSVQSVAGRTTECTLRWPAPATPGQVPDETTQTLEHSMCTAHWEFTFVYTSLCSMPALRPELDLPGHGGVRVGSRLKGTVAL